MILVVGETYDSLLGLRSLLGKTDGIEPLVNDLPGFIGKFGEEEIVAVTGGTSDYLSLLSTEKAILLYKPRLVVCLGEATSLSPLLKLGDIVIGNRLYIHGVNFGATGLPYGSIPGFKSFFFSDINFARKAEDVALKHTALRAIRGDVLSGEKKIVEQDEFTSILLRRYASSAHLLCYDCTSGGVALACQVEKIPFLPLKAITYLPLEGEEGMLKERRIALTANEGCARLLLEILRREEE